MTPIEVEAGCMFSGKTSELIRLIKRLPYAKKEQGSDYLVFNHHIDDRHGENTLGNHDGEKIPAIGLVDSIDLAHHIFDFDENGLPTVKPELKKISNIFIDEAQFFDQNLGTVLTFIDQYFISIRGKGIKIYCAGLDMDFRGEPFGPMPDLMARAKKVKKFAAVCNEDNCDKDAQYTQRIVNGKPADYSDPIVKVGATESYQARCKRHHELPGRPNKLPLI